MKEENIEVSGIVLENINGTMFKVQICGTNHIVNAYVSGKMFKNTITVIGGDRVLLQISKYDLTKARIKFRQKNDSKESSIDVKK